MKQILIATLLVLAVISGNAKNKDGKTNDTKTETTTLLSGSIADEKSGESLVGVEVKIEGTDLKTYTDFDGNFSFDGLKSGEYKLITNYISYQKQTKVMNVNSNENEITLKLQSSN